MGPHCWWWGPGYFFGSPWNMLLGGLFWIVVVVAALWVLKRSGDGHDGRESALRILEERYARGEISDDEFVRRKQALGGA